MNPMDIKQLKYFLVIAEEKQITAAAKKLNISQPPLSYQLRLLEEELGVTLVQRGARNVQLTSAGELLQKRAEQILELTDSTVREVNDYGKGLKGTLSIGTISSSGSIVTAEPMQQFRRDFPNIRFEVHEGNTFSVMDMLEKGIIEIGIVRTPFKSGSVHVRYASVEPMMAIMTPENLCGQEDNTISLQELDGKPLILYRRFDTLLHDVFEKNGIELLIRCRNDDARTTILWAQAGFGIGIVPKSALRIFGAGNLRYKEITSEELRTRLAVIWAKNRYLSTIGQKFVDIF